MIGNYIAEIQNSVVLVDSSTLVIAGLIIDDSEEEISVWHDSINCSVRIIVCFFRVYYHGNQKFACQYISER